MKRNVLLKKIAAMTMAALMSMSVLGACGDSDIQKNTETEQASEALDTEEATETIDVEVVDEGEFDLSKCPNVSVVLDYATCYNMLIADEDELEDEFWDKMISAFICNSYCNVDIGDYNQVLTKAELEEVASQFVGRTVKCNVYEDDFTLDRANAASPYLGEHEKQNMKVTYLDDGRVKLDFEFSYACCSLTTEMGLKQVSAVLVKNPTSFLDGYSITNMMVITVKEPVDSQE